MRTEHLLGCIKKYCRNKVDDNTLHLIMALRVKTCKDIKKSAGRRDTREKARMYSHVGHKPDVICIAPDFSILPANCKLGILLHEVGHIATGLGNEPEADLWVKDVLGITVNYYSDLELEYINNNWVEEICG